MLPQAIGVPLVEILSAAETKRRSDEAWERKCHGRGGRGVVDVRTGAARTVGAEVLRMWAATRLPSMLLLTASSVNAAPDIAAGIACMQQRPLVNRWRYGGGVAGPDEQFLVHCHDEVKSVA